MIIKNFRTPALILFTGLMLVSCMPRQEITTPAYRTKLLDSLMTAAVDNGEIPGAVAYIKKGGQERYHKAFGYRDMEEEVLMEQSDIFRMASMTKGLTAVGVLQLAERGLFFLDDPISDYIPEFAHPQILDEINEDSTFLSHPAKSEITIRQLLTHTSGIGYGFQDERYNSLVIKNNISEGFGFDDRTSMENIRRIARLPLLFEPGEKYTYGLSYDVLGVLIEVVSGLRYDHYISEYILDPLKMEESYFIVPDEERYRLVKAYETVLNGLSPTSYSDVDYPVLSQRRFFSGGADLCSTAEDYAKFVQMVLRGGVYDNTRILGEAYIRMMLMPQTPFDEGGAFQGFAAWITNEKGAAEGPFSEGSFGFGGFWDTYSWADPSGDFVAVLLLQMYPGNRHRIHQKFQQITYGIVEDL